MSYEIRVFWCNLCDGISIECPHCGNNSCNGGSGKAKPDSWPAGAGEEVCPVCAKVSKLSDALHESGIMKLFEDLVPDEEKAKESLEELTFKKLGLIK